MAQLVPVDKPQDILGKYRGTPVEDVLRYHNLKEPLPERAVKAEILIGTCIDYREDFNLPHDFSFRIRTAGGNMRNHEFQISYAVAVGKVTTIALISHTDCGMSAVTQRKEEFVRGLVERAGCSPQEALRQFDQFAPAYEIGDPVQFIIRETARIRELYPKLLVAPLLYRVEDDKLVQIVEEGR